MSWRDAGALRYPSGPTKKSEGASPQAARDLIRRWQDVGGTHAVVRTMGLNLATPEQHIDQLAESGGTWLERRLLNVAAGRLSGRMRNG